MCPKRAPKSGQKMGANICALLVSLLGRHLYPLGPTSIPNSTKCDPGSGISDTPDPWA